MRTVLVLFTLLLGTAGFTLATGEKGNGEWNKVSEYRGIVGYTRPTPRCRIDEIKAVGMVDAPLAVVEAVIRDVPAGKDYLFLCKEAALIEIPGMKNAPDDYNTYCLTDMPLPVSDRDMVARVTWTSDKVTGTVYVHGEGLNMDYRLVPGVVRMTQVMADYTLTPKGADRTEVTYQSLADPGGNLPAWVVKLFSRNLGVKTIAGLREMAKFDRYKHALVVVTSTPQKK